MARIIFIVAQQGFRDEELLVPKKLLESRSHECKIASITTNTAYGSKGGFVKPDLAVKDIKLDDLDCLVVIGGPGSPSLMKYSEVTDLLKSMAKTQKRLAAICFAPAVLANAGILEGKKVTVFESPDALDFLEKGKAIFVNRPVVIDGLLTTGNGPAAAQEFGEVLAKQLA